MAPAIWRAVGQRRGNPSSLPYPSTQDASPTTLPLTTTALSPSPSSSSVPEPAGVCGGHSGGRPGLICCRAHTRGAGAACPPLHSVAASTTVLPPLLYGGCNVLAVRAHSATMYQKLAPSLPIVSSTGAAGGPFGQCVCWQQRVRAGAHSAALLVRERGPGAAGKSCGERADEGL